MIALRQLFEAERAPRGNTTYLGALTVASAQPAADWRLVVLGVV
jgi:hypothetical protein